MKFRTQIEDLYFPFKIDHKQKVLFLGSCFTSNIGERFQYFGFSPKINPFGIVYNPISIFEHIERAIDQRLCNNSDFFLVDEVWKSFNFHSDISGTNLDILLKNVNSIISKTFAFLQQADLLFLTFGTSNGYKNKKTGNLVTNNHKIPLTEFEPYKIPVDEIVNAFYVFYKNLKKINNSVKIILTVSPVRHTRPGLIENSRSKARLLNAIENIVDHNQVFYFPAYEILVDDLRDYRYYDTDLIHPNYSGIDYIWNYFGDAFFDNETLEINKKIDKIKTSFGHRPFYPETTSYKIFRENLNKEISDFNSKYPYINLELE